MYVHYGCGHDVGKSWSNFDVSPMLRFEKIPGGKIAKKLVDTGSNFPPEVMYGNILNGPLVTPGTANCVYASHVLEHLSYADACRAISTTFDMLQAGGTFRLVVPDLEWRARLYIESLNKGDSGASGAFLRQTLLGHETRDRSLLGKARLAFGGSAHLWMWDEPAMTDALKAAGFQNIRRCDFGDASDPAFSELEIFERFWVTMPDGTKHKELALEASKP